MFRIGIDFGGSHLSIALIDKNKICSIKTYVYINACNNKSLNKVLVYAKKHIFNLIENNNVESIGVSLPGDCENGVLLNAINIKNFKVKNIKLVYLLEKIFNIPVFIENDAICSLMGERKYGSLKKYPNSILFTFGTGVGYAICKQGDILNYKVKNYLDVINSKYKNRLLSVENLRNIYSIKINKPDIERYGIFNDINNNAKKAIEVFDEYINNMSIGIERLSRITKINTFCIGGGLSEVSELFIDKLKNNLPNLNIFISENLNNAGLIGATLIKEMKS